MRVHGCDRGGRVIVHDRDRGGHASAYRRDRDGRVNVRVRDYAHVRESDRDHGYISGHQRAHAHLHPSAVS